MRITVSAQQDHACQGHYNTDKQVDKTIYFLREKVGCKRQIGSFCEEHALYCER
jgi:hypothetical protein